VDREELAAPRVAAAHAGALDAEVVSQIGKEVELAHALSKNGVDPHPLVYALARGWNGATVGESDGLYGGESEGYTVMLARRQGHFTIVRFGRTDGSELAPRAVLRILRLANRLEGREGELPLPDAVAALNEALAPENLRLFALPADARPEALALAGVAGAWESAAPSERSGAARQWANAKHGATPRDLVLASWGATVPREKLFAFVENLPA